MEKILNLVSGGMMGDFINSLYAVKNICHKHRAKANLFLNNGGDPFKYGIQKAFDDLKEIVLEQPYINSFTLETASKPCINLNEWRSGVRRDYLNGGYKKSWSEVFSRYYRFNIPNEYQWLFTNKIDKKTQGKTLVHRSTKRHNENFDWEGVINEDVLFITTDKNEYNGFAFRDKVELYLVNTISEMAIAISSCKKFIGNQSAPFAIASAFDKERICELDKTDAIFYAGEVRYSQKIIVNLHNARNSTRI